MTFHLFFVVLSPSFLLILLRSLVGCLYRLVIVVVELEFTASMMMTCHMTTSSVIAYNSLFLTSFIHSFSKTHMYYDQCCFGWQWQSILYYGKKWRHFMISYVDIWHFCMCVCVCFFYYYFTIWSMQFRSFRVFFLSLSLEESRISMITDYWWWWQNHSVLTTHIWHIIFGEGVEHDDKSLLLLLLLDEPKIWSDI